MARNGPVCTSFVNQITQVFHHFPFYHAVDELPGISNAAFYRTIQHKCELGRIPEIQRGPALAAYIAFRTGADLPSFPSSPVHLKARWT